LLKRTKLTMVVVTMLLVPSLVFAAADKFGAAQAFSGEENTIVVPLNVTNQDNLAAMDIALGFSEGVTLEAVTFEDTRVEYFDLKIANINNEEKTVVIGLLPQMTHEAKPDLEAGTGTVAKLHFRVDDQSIDDITLEAITTEVPYHSLTFVYHDGDQITTEKPEFENVTVSLSGVTSPEVPDVFELAQNYPNPFNPTTTVSFSLPKASQVRLEIFNVLGQSVATLVDGRLDAGKHDVLWSADGNASGVYFYKLVTESNTATKKMMLLK